ncbi:SNF2 family N-terminal domain-containing protein [Hypoxylon crocopeplum]|nr:SNF2 family N-terminal domain-containing protein [Hypoxylon crocopeplum]
MAEEPGADKPPATSELINSNLRSLHDRHIAHGRLDLHSVLQEPQAIDNFCSNQPIHPTEITVNHNFTGWTIEESVRDYSPDNCYKVTGEVMQGEKVAVGNRSIPKKIIETIRAGGHHEIDAEESNGKETEDEILQDVGAITQTIISASPNSVGPPIQPCAMYLGMEPCGTYGRNGLTLWKSPFLPGFKGLLDTQITAVVWILSRFFGILPKLKLIGETSLDSAEHEYIPTVETRTENENRERLRGPRYFGGILADSMGMGKTLTTIALLDLLASQNLNATEEKGKKKYRPMLILTPNATVATQWVDDISQFASPHGIKQIIVSGNGLQQNQGKRLVRILTNKEFTTEWPPDLTYVWDEDKQMAGQTVIIMSIDTWSSRTCKIRGPNKNSKGKSEYYSTFADMGREFSTLVVDEAYKVRNTATRNWASVALTNRQFTLLVTATPCMNVMADLLGPVKILWQNVLRYLIRIGKWGEIKTRYETSEDLQLLVNLALYDDHQLVAGWPPITAKDIIRERKMRLDIEKIRASLKFLESLAILQRSATSHLPVHWDSDAFVSLEGLLPNVNNYTVNIQSDRKLETDYQEVHVDLLTRYLQALSSGKKQEEGNFPNSLTGIYRHFQIAAASVDLFHLDQLLGANGFGTKAEHVKIMRSMNVNLMHLAPFLLNPWDEMPEVAVDYVKLAVRGSPVLRYILHYVKENLLGRDPNGKIKKLLIIEASPILAYFYELVLQFLLINCQTLHSGLNPDERRALVASFNDDSDHSCQILIQMYTVGFAGSNLHKSCNRAIVASQAQSFAVQSQAQHRIIRVGQEADVTVHRLKVNNSFHAFAESKQIDKILPELGTRAQGPMNDVFVDLLNLFQNEVDDAWKSPEAQRLIRTRRLTADRVAEPEEDKPGSKSMKTNDGASAEVKAAPYGFARAPRKSLTKTQDKSDKVLGKRKRGDGDRHDERIRESRLFQPGGFLCLQTRDQYYAEYRGLPAYVKSKFSHAKNGLRRLLSYGNPTNNNATPRVWKVPDLDNGAVLERAMELTMRIRLGTGRLEMLPLPQIDVSLAPKPMRERLAVIIGKNDATHKAVEAAAKKRISAAKAKSYEDSRMLQGINEAMTLLEIDEVFEAEQFKVPGTGKGKGKGKGKASASTSAKKPEADMEEVAEGSASRPETTSAHVMGASEDEEEEDIEHELGDGEDLDEREREDLYGAGPIRHQKEDSDDELGDIYGDAAPAGPTECATDFADIDIDTTSNIIE